MYLIRKRVDLEDYQLKIPCQIIATINLILKLRIINLECFRVDNLKL